MCLVAIIQHVIEIERITYEILQILSISLTDKTIFRDLFNKTNFNNDKERCGFSEPSLFNFQQFAFLVDSNEHNLKFDCK